jgi:hypothetical protein
MRIKMKYGVTLRTVVTVYVEVDVPYDVTWPEEFDGHHGEAIPESLMERALRLAPNSISGVHFAEDENDTNFDVDVTDGDDGEWELEYAERLHDDETEK